jgi:hypothetical protein
MFVVVQARPVFFTGHPHQRQSFVPKGGVDKPTQLVEVWTGLAVTPGHPPLDNHFAVGANDISRPGNVDRPSNRPQFRVVVGPPGLLYRYPLDEFVVLVDDGEPTTIRRVASSHPTVNVKYHARASKSLLGLSGVGEGTPGAVR